MDDRPRVKELIIVEGKCDISAVKKSVIGDVIETKGFGVFNDTDLQKLIRILAADRGAVLLTDSDRSGFRIRGKLKSILCGVEIKQAYIPQIKGKERRKSVPSADGFLGVEAMRENVIVEALYNAGATFINGDTRLKQGNISKADLYALGLSGHKDSAAKRAALMKKLDLPEGITANALLDIINLLFDRESFISYIEQQMTEI